MTNEEKIDIIIKLAESKIKTISNMEYIIISAPDDILEWNEYFQKWIINKIVCDNTKEYTKNAITFHEYHNEHYMFKVDISLFREYLGISDDVYISDKIKIETKFREYLASLK